jgi:hypothetical protein
MGRVLRAPPLVLALLFPPELLIETSGIECRIIGLSSGSLSSGGCQTVYGHHHHPRSSTRKPKKSPRWYLSSALLCGRADGRSQMSHLRA